MWAYVFLQLAHPLEHFTVLERQIITFTNNTCLPLSVPCASRWDMRGCDKELVPDELEKQHVGPSLPFVQQHIALFPHVFHLSIGGIVRNHWFPQVLSKLLSSLDYCNLLWASCTCHLTSAAHPECSNLTKVSHITTLLCTLQLPVTMDTSRHWYLPTMLWLA